MLYCFVEKSLKLKMNEALRIQASYAIKLGCFIMITNNSQSIVDENHVKVNIENKIVFLRTDYEHINDAMTYVIANGGILFESSQDRTAISKWPLFYKPKREIILLDNFEIYPDSKFKESVLFSKNKEPFFLKSLSKGISRIIAYDDIINPSSDLYYELNKKDISIHSQFMVSEQISICKDRYGNIEVRFIVIDNTVLNYSRYFHSLNHEIDDELIMKANEIVEALANINDFPDNYVIDLAKICSQNEEYIDVIEFNPLSTSLCYVNNSIFNVIIPEIEEMLKSCSFGAEYCFDMISSPADYILHSNDFVDPRYST